MIFKIYSLPPWTFGALVMGFLLLAAEAGIWNGKRLAKKSKPGKGSDLEIGALLALMGLMLAFTYSFNSSRIDLRKQALVAEANALGTAFLRADLLPEPGRTELRQRLLQYTKTRIVSDEARQSLALFQQAILESAAERAKLWPAVKEVLRPEVPSHLQMLLIQAVNDVIDADATRMTVGFDRMAPSILLFLIILAAVSVALSAQNGARDGSISRGRSTMFALTLSGLIFIIVDFDNSSRGFIVVNQSSLVSLVAEMEADLVK